MPTVPAAGGSSALPSQGVRGPTQTAAFPGTGTPATAAPLLSPSGSMTPVYVDFSSPFYSASEGSGNTSITVDLTAASSQNVTVRYQTGGGTGLPGTDYTPVSGTLTFTPGQTVQSFTIPVLDDGGLDEGGPNETAGLTLTNPTNASLGPTSSGTLTILEESTPPPIAGANAFAALEAVPFNGPVATFTGAPGRTASDFTTIINWGDGTSSAGTVSANGTGGFTVTGAHTYQEEGQYAAAVQITDLPTGTASTVLSLGVVLTLDQDTTLQVPGPASLTYGAGTSQSGTDSGGTFSLLETGTLNYTLQKTISEVGDSYTSTSNVSVGFNLQESGSDAVGALSVGSYSLGATASDTTTRQQTANDLTNYASGSTTDSITTSIQETGNDTTGDYTLTQYGSGTTSAQESGADGTGNLQVTTTGFLSTSLSTTGNWVSGTFTRTLTQSDSLTVTTTGNDYGENYTQTQTRSDSSTLPPTRPRAATA